MAALSPTNAPCVFKAYCNFSASGVLTIQRTNGGNTVTEYVNSGNALLANVPYTFYVHVDSGETIDFQYSATCTINKFSVVEYDLPSSNQTDTSATALVQDLVGLFKQNQNIGSIVSPITSRSKISAGYQESTLYLNNANGSPFLSGSSADSSGNYAFYSVDPLLTNTPSSSTTGYYVYFVQVAPTISFRYLQIQVKINTSSVRVGLYSGAYNSSTNTLVKDWGQQTITSGSLTTLNLDIGSLQASGTYTLAFAVSATNEAIYYYSSGTGGGISNVNYYSSGFPSSNLAAGNGASTWGANCMLTVTSASNPISLTYSLEQVDSTTFSGQQVIKLGIYPDQSQNYSITSISITTKGISAGTIRAANPSDVTGTATANVDTYITDAGNVNSGNPITINAGDTFEVVISFQISYAGTGATNFYLDNVNGVSYVVLPLQ